MLSEAISSTYRIEAIILRDDVELPKEVQIPEQLVFWVNSVEFQKLSSQVNPEGVLIVLHFPDESAFVQVEVPNFEIGGPAFVLAGIQDPGNLGTIIRTADWFGMKTIICGPGTTDCFNPKVLRSSMGSLFRLRIIYINDLEAWLRKNTDRVWLADMYGIGLDQADVQSKPFVLLGNEALGVSDSIRNIEGLTKITIPRFGQAESLNAASAAAVLAWTMVQKQ